MLSVIAAAPQTVRSGSAAEEAQTAGAACAVSSQILKSSTTSKRVPLPSWLCSVMTPPIMSTMFLVMAMPRPVPCTLLVTEFSARLKDS